MQILKYPLIVIVIYLLVLFETSFFVHFNIPYISINILLVLTIIWNIFEETKKSTGILIAFTSGFFLDIFSSRFMGYNIIILLISAYFIKFIFRKYVRIPFVKET